MESSVGAEFRAFARLRTLLKQVSTRHPKQEIDLSLGEINFSGSTKIVTTLQPSKNWSKYPPLGGTSDLREAYLNWHQRRSQVSNFSGVDVEPTPGTKQAISSLLFLAASQARAQFCANPVIAIPNPFYPTFGIAGEYAGAEVRLISVLETDYADAIRRLVAEVGHRLTCVILCNPNTPFGHVLTEHELRRVAALASELGFWLIIDECYLDFGVKCSPKSIVHCLLEHKLSCKNIVALHTLSKRSAAPGLRSGFLIGDERIVSCYSQFNRQCGVSNSTLVCTTATQLWDNDSLVEECRSRVIENWELANQLLNDWAGSLFLMLAFSYGCP